MRHLTIIILILTAVMVSCTIDRSDNGDFDGFWHLERIDTIATGGVCDLSEQTSFWGVEYNLIQMEASEAHYFYHFTRSADSLVIHNPFYNAKDCNESGQGDDIRLYDPAKVNGFGVEGLEVHYKIQKLNGSRMELKSPTLILYFRKF